MCVRGVSAHGGGANFSCALRTFVDLYLARKESYFDCSVVNANLRGGGACIRESAGNYLPNFLGTLSKPIECLDGASPQAQFLPEFVQLVPHFHRRDLRGTDAASLHGVYATAAVSRTSPEHSKQICECTLDRWFVWFVANVPWNSHLILRHTYCSTSSIRILYKYKYKTAVNSSF